MKFHLIIISILISSISFAQQFQKTEQSKVWSFQDCVNYALENNLVVKEAKVNTAISEVDYNKAKSSKLPNLFANASQSFSNGNTIDPITSDYVTDQIYSTNAGINSSMTIFKGNQLNNQIEQNNLFLSQSILQEEVEKNSIVLNLLEIYLQTLYSKESITIAQNNLEASEKEVLRSKARLDAGSITLRDYTEAQSQAASNQYDVIAAKNNYQQYIVDLKQLLELLPSEDIEIEVISENIDLLYLEPNKIEIYKKSLEFLPELKVSNVSILATEKELAISKSDFSPTLSLTGSIGSGYTSINDSNFSNQFSTNFNQGLGLSLSVPIFNRNQTKAATQTATLNIEKAEIQKLQVKKEIYKKVENAYQNALSSQEQVIAAEASKVAAQESYKLAQKSYELGSLSTTDLVLSQNTYTNAQQNYLQAKYLNVLYHQLLQFYQGNEIKLN